LGVPKGRVFQLTIGPHSNQYETRIITIQENWIIQYDLSGLKSVPCARLFAACYRYISLFYLKQDFLKSGYLQTEMICGGLNR